MPDKKLAPRSIPTQTDSHRSQLHFPATTTAVMMPGYMLLLLLVPTLAIPVAPEDNEVAGARSADDGNWGLLLKIVAECAEKDTTACLGAKAVTALQRAARLNSVELADGVAFVKTKEPQVQAALASEADVRRSLEEQPAERNARFIDLMAEAMAGFFESHSLQVSMPKEVPQALQRALEEGRGKKKMLKMLLPLILGVGAKLLLLIPAGIGLLGLVATKALLVSKLALLLAGGLAVQKLLSGGGLGFGGGKNGWQSGATQGWSGAGSSGGWSSGGSGGYSSGPAASAGWSRSIDAHDLAFAAQAPQPAAAQ